MMERCKSEAKIMSINDRIKKDLTELYNNGATRPLHPGAKESIGVSPTIINVRNKKSRAYGIAIARLHAPRIPKG